MIDTGIVITMFYSYRINWYFWLGVFIMQHITIWSGTSTQESLQLVGSSIIRLIQMHLFGQIQLHLDNFLLDQVRKQ